MKRTKEESAFHPIRSSIFWREDLADIVALLQQFTNESVSIHSGQYQYESLDELFSRFGPKIPELKLETARSGLRIYVNLMSSGSNYYVRSDDELHDVVAELGKFLKERRSIVPYVFILAAGAAILAILVGALFAINDASSTFKALVGIPIFFAISATIVTVAFYASMGKTVAIRNRSKSVAMFAAHDRWKQNIERIALLLLGSGLTLLTQWIAGFVD